jgi:hypothetical protein
MHLMIPFAAPLAEDGWQALRRIELPHLQSLLGRLTETEREVGEAYTLSTPHERAWARACGWQGADGCLPFAAQQAADDGIDPGDAAFGRLSPCFWHVGRDNLTVGDPDALGLDAATSRAFFDAVRALFEEEGWRILWGAPTRWYVAHASLDDLPCASLDRVIGRNPDVWMPDHPQARLLKRLQNEVQMLLYTHPLNDAREAAALPPLNSVWLDGCGVAQGLRGAAPTVLDGLRAPALRDDWAVWAEAWQAVDAGPLAMALEQLERGAPVRLSLSGECGHASFTPQPRSAWQRLAARWRKADVAAALQGL